MALSGTTPPVMHWDSSNLPSTWEKIERHIELIFSGPLQKNQKRNRNRSCSYGWAKKAKIFHKHG
ncbi:hypothetical protein DPMN_118575 [Dreissena polymorpha]|uniref:Uncharacterized protein n=1 Tax=Dreissena polymorpha TaxID=45954 RepID=A0A9D4GHN3_DREPO|nr:hypothetical protein DPMN_118575 [Dreissena polymorpha]